MAVVVVMFGDDERQRCNGRCGEEGLACASVLIEKFRVTFVVSIGQRFTGSRSLNVWSNNSFRIG